MGRGSGDNKERVTLDGILGGGARRTVNKHLVKKSHDNLDRSVFEVRDLDTGEPVSIGGAPTMWVTNGDEIHREEWRNAEGRRHRDGADPAVMNFDPRSGELTSEWWTDGERSPSPYGFNTILRSRINKDASADLKVQNRAKDYDQTGDLDFDAVTPSEIVILPTGDISEIHWKSYLGKHREDAPMTIVYGLRDRPESIVIGRNGLVGGVARDEIQCDASGKMIRFKRLADEGMTRAEVTFRIGELKTMGCSVKDSRIIFTRDGLPNVEIKELNAFIKASELERAIPKEMIRNARSALLYKPQFPFSGKLPV